MDTISQHSVIAGNNANTPGHVIHQLRMSIPMQMQEKNIDHKRFDMNMYALFTKYAYDNCKRKMGLMVATREPIGRGAFKEVYEGFAIYHQRTSSNHATLKTKSYALIKLKDNQHLDRFNEEKQKMREYGEMYKEYLVKERLRTQKLEGNDNQTLGGAKVCQRVQIGPTHYNVQKLLNGSLEDKKQQYTEMEFLQKMLPIVKLVSNLHKRELCHLDIKLSNIFCDFPQNGGKLILGDMSFADVANTEWVNTTGYLTNEFLMKESFNMITRDDKIQADIYALGRLFEEFLINENDDTVTRRWREKNAFWRTIFAARLTGQSPSITATPELPLGNLRSVPEFTPELNGRLYQIVSNMISNPGLDLDVHYRGFCSLFDQYFVQDQDFQFNQFMQQNPQMAPEQLIGQHRIYQNPYLRPNQLTNQIQQLPQQPPVQNRANQNFYLPQVQNPVNQNPQPLNYNVQNQMDPVAGNNQVPQQQPMFNQMPQNPIRPPAQNPVNQNLQFTNYNVQGQNIGNNQMQQFSPQSPAQNRANQNFYLPPIQNPVNQNPQPLNYNAPQPMNRDASNNEVQRVAQQFTGLNTTLPMIPNEVQPILTQNQQNILDIDNPVLQQSAPEMLKSQLNFERCEAVKQKIRTMNKSELRVLAGSIIRDKVSNESMQKHHLDSDKSVGAWLQNNNSASTNYLEKEEKVDFGDNNTTVGALLAQCFAEKN